MQSTFLGIWLRSTEENRMTASRLWQCKPSAASGETEGLLSQDRCLSMCRREQPQCVRTGNFPSATVRVTQGGRRGLRSPARVAGELGWLNTVSASPPWLAHPLCGNRKCGLRPQTPPPAWSEVFDCFAGIPGSGSQNRSLNCHLFLSRDSTQTPTEFGVVVPADFWAFDSMRRGPLPQTLPPQR